MADLLRRTSRYLDDHWVVKWFVAPILLMASALFGLGLVLVSPAETVQLTGLFAGFSLAVVAVGVLLDWTVRAVVGGSLFTSNRDRGEE
jgi:hypothetical protein